MGPGRRMQRRLKPVRVCSSASRDMLMKCKMRQLYAFGQGCHLPVVALEIDAMQLEDSTPRYPRRKQQAFQRRSKEE
jgi:hypothetical protein